MKQQARQFAIEGLEKYEKYDKNGNERPLENFIWTHVRNRLFNFKRDNYQRPDKPCDKCPIGAYRPNDLHDCVEFEDKHSCELYHTWATKNESRWNILNPIDLNDVRDEAEDNMKVFNDNLTNLDANEIINLIDDNLPVDYREDFLKLKYNIKIGKTKKERLLKKIFEILEENGIDAKETW